MRDLKIKMRKFAETLDASTERAQCLNIANFSFEDGETIAGRLKRDHRSCDGAMRAARLMVAAGCAREEKTERQKIKDLFGTFIFLGGSTI